MKNKVILLFFLVTLLLIPFTVSERNDEVKAVELSDETIGFYQSTTCKISLTEFYLVSGNKNIDIFYNNNNYADISCFGKITGVDKVGQSYMVSIGTNTSINLILQSSLWFIIFLLIPKIKSKKKLEIKYSFLLPFLFIFQFIGENRFYSETNILHDINIAFNNYYLLATIMFYFLSCLLIFDIFENRYLNIVNYLPFTFLFVGTFSGMNLNLYLILFSFFGLQSLFIDKNIEKIDFLYLIFSLAWLFNTYNNDYFFDGDKLRGFTNSSYSLASQVFWISIFYLLLKGIIFLVRESKNSIDINKLRNNSLMTGSLVLFFGIIGAHSPIFNFFNFYFFGQNKRGMKVFESIAGNTWRGFASSAESIGEFYSFSILLLVLCLVYKKNKIFDPYMILLIPVFYGLFRSNNFASILSLVLIVLFLLFQKTNIYKKFKVLIFTSFALLSFLTISIYLYTENYEYLSTELIYEATLHQDFYSGPNDFTSYKEVEKKMIERDLGSIIADKRNIDKSSSSYKYIVDVFTQNFNIPLVPNIISIISIISLNINRTEMWGIFIAKHNPNLYESIFGSGPMQLNNYLYNHNIKLDVPEEKLQALYLPHSSLLDIVIFSGVLGLLILGVFIFYTFRNKNTVNFFKILMLFLLVNLLKSDSILYLNSFLLFSFCLTSLYYYENSDIYE